ncbi:penicillin-binding protein [Ferdinandcohnia quinoae]|uniref:serine-type D-Ala-D-Ala carboxypeptidase n=1 Tax=Fredinandcohnia quinoae TaxID=2918902 RepID=A0AAW5DTB1_9BACI|nr:penicillin-binding protein [Fredinandcohnia sp. SECRCQ15]
MKTKNNNINRGAAIISVVFALLFFTLIMRFVQIQGSGKADGVVLAVIAEEKYTKQRMIDAKRGTIFDRNGKIVAEDTAAYTVVAVLDKELTHVEDPEGTAQKLAPLLNMKVDDMLKILTRKKNSNGREIKQVEFGPNGRNINFELKEKIEALKLPGIGFRRELKRYYPNGTFASHLIGYAQKVQKDDEGNENVTVGMMGVEKGLDKYLHETDGKMKYLSDRKGYKLPDANEQIVPPDNGDDVYLTIDQTIQTFLEDAMNNAVKEYEPEKIIGLVANPKTGEILAMGSRPSFDPNKRNITNYLNDAIYPFEPGSTMKIFTLAAAIEEGVYKGNAQFTSGKYEAGGRTIRDHNYSGWGTITYDDGVLKSSNVGFAKIANEQLGTDRLLQYISRFGLDRPTGIDIDGEVQNTINFKYKSDQVSTAFGQASSVTPIQQIQAATAIANGGVMMKPFIIDKIVDPETNKTIQDHKPEISGNPVSAETADKVLDLLERVVNEGTGKYYDIDGYQVAGKTGTAEIASPEGGYLHGRGNYFYSFMGMAPKDDPKLIVYIAVKKPNLKDTEIGPEPVASIFNPVMKNSLQYLNIQPTEKKESPDNVTGHTLKLDDLLNKKPGEAKEVLQSKQLQAIIVGKGKKITDQSPKPGENVVQGQKVFLMTDGEQFLPNVIGWSLRDVMRLSDLLQLKLSFEGNGFVVEQKVPPNSIVKKGDHFSIKLEPPKAQLKTEEKKESENDTKED